MKKTLLLSAIAATGLLASCGPAVILDSGYYGNSNTSSSVRLTGLTNYTTNRTLPSNVTDQNGRTIQAGTYIICRNWDTDVNFTVNWTGTLSSIGFQFKGYNTGEYLNTDEYTLNNPTAGSANATFVLEPNMAPLKLAGQAITVVPKVDVLGYTYVRAQGRDGNGYASNVVETSFSIPVMTCYNS